MTTPTNTPAGVNVPALPIVWHKLSEMWSATSAERAVIGPYELIAFDIPPAGSHPRIIAWELHTGPQFMTGIAGAPADSFEAAKAAAEQEARRLLTGLGVSATVAETDRPTVGPVPTALPTMAASNSDAALLAAFAEWCRVSVVMENLPAPMSDADRQSYSDAITRAESKLGAPALTAAGVEVKLLHAFATLAESPDAYDAVWSGTAPTTDGEALSDARHAMLWSAIQDLRRMNGGAA